MSPVRTSRVQLRIREDLKEAMVAYADRNDTSLSQLVTDHFTVLLAEEREKTRLAQRPVDAQQA